MADVKQMYPMMCSSGRKIYQVARQSVVQYFGGLAKYIIRKRQQMLRVVQDMETHKALCAALETETDMVKVEALLQRLEGLAAPESSLAFSKLSVQEQEDLIRTSCYADEWCEVRNAKGVVVGAITSYYICVNDNAWLKNGAKTCCLKVIPSKDWDRTGSTPEACRRWCCTDCNMKFRASWGQVVIVNTIDDSTLQPVRYYLRAEVPPWACEDVRAMCLEEARPDLKDPKALYESLKRVVPQRDKLIVEREGCKADDRYFVSRAMLDSLPFFDWHKICNLAGTEMPEELNRMLPKKDRKPPR